MIAFTEELCSPPYAIVSGRLLASQGAPGEGVNEGTHAAHLEGAYRQPWFSQVGAGYRRIVPTLS